jgi:hypothetical protein
MGPAARARWGAPQGDTLSDLTYDTLQREISRRILRATFMHGQGAPLAFLWAAGAGLFTITWGLPQYAVVWSLASLGFAGLMGRDSLRSSKNWAAASRQLLEARFTTDRISESRHREAVRKGIDLFHEVLLKIGEMKRNGNLDSDVRDVVAEMDRLLTLQCESARQVEELERILSLVGIDGKLSAGRVKLRAENEAAIRNEVAEVESVIDQINERLETLLLQVYRVEAGGTDLMARTEARRRSSEALERIQEIVDARRAAARQLIDMLSPEWGEGDPGSGVPGPALGAVATLTPAAPQPAMPPSDLAQPLNRNRASDVAAEELVPLVEEALRKLNSPGALASCLLVERLPRTITARYAGAIDRRTEQLTPLDRAHALRDALVAAIERLRPESSEVGSPRPDAAQHTILHDAYVQGLPVKAILARNGISESTFHRYRRDATLVLARELASQEQALAHGTITHHPPLTRISTN